MFVVYEPLCGSIICFIGVDGWGCPRELRMNLIEMLICALWKSLPISISSTDATKFPIVLHSISIGPLNFGEQMFFGW